MSIKINENKINRFSESIEYIFALDLKSKEKIADDIFKKQPQLLFEAIGLHHIGVPIKKIEYVTNLLLIFYDYFTNRGNTELPMVTENMISAARKNITAMLQLLDKEGPETGWPLMKMSVEAYPEVEVLAFLYGYMNDNGFTQKAIENEYCLRVSKVILDCLVNVTRNKQNSVKCKKTKK